MRSEKQAGWAVGWVDVRQEDKNQQNKLGVVVVMDIKKQNFI
jgi:hypothetical protein